MKFTTRYLLGVKASDRLLFDDAIFNITAAINIKGRNREWLIMAERLGA